MLYSALRGPHIEIDYATITFFGSYQLSESPSSEFYAPLEIHIVAMLSEIHFPETIQKH